MRNNPFIAEKVVTLLPEETIKWGEKLGESLPAGSVIALFGELGAGKTTLIKGLVRGATGLASEIVSSPTFTYLHLYSGIKTVYHFDLYRLRMSDAFLSMGFDEYFSAGGICCIEWPDKIEALLPKDAIRVAISYREEGQREIRISREDISEEASF